MAPPHTWNGDLWTCLRCGETHRNPCACPCHPSSWRDEYMRSE